jgi:hypothetical protein
MGIVELKRAADEIPREERLELAGELPQRVPDDAGENQPQLCAVAHCVCSHLSHRRLVTGTATAERQAPTPVGSGDL